jgi:site-specific recombinase XerD
MTTKEKEQFTAYLQARHLHGKTVKDYLSRVNQYLQWLQSHVEKEAEQAEKKDVLNYLHYLQTHTQPDMGTRQHTLGMINRYYAYLLQNERVTKNPAQLINLRGTRKQRLLKLFTVEEMAELADAHYYLCVKYEVNPPNLNLRNHIALLLFIYQGIKPQELNLLNIEALDLHKAVIKIPATRKTNARTLPLHATQIGLLNHYLQHTHAFLKNPKQLLINAVPKDFTKDLKKLQTKFISFKQLRASIITYWIQTQGLRKAQYNAGHRYISSTQNYLANDIESLKNDINKYHPIQTVQKN